MPLRDAARNAVLLLAASLPLAWSLVPGLGIARAATTVDRPAVEWYREMLADPSVQTARLETIARLEELIEKTDAGDHVVTMYSRLGSLNYQVGHMLLVVAEADHEAALQRCAWEPGCRPRHVVLDADEAFEHLEKAVAAYQVVLDAYPTCEQRETALYHHALALDDLGRSDEALVSVRRLATEFPRGNYTRTYRARIELLGYEIQRLEYERAVLALHKSRFSREILTLNAELKRIERRIARAEAASSPLLDNATPGSP